MEDSAPAKFELGGLDSHPVTGSNIQLALFDTFHQGNAKHEVESLWRIGCSQEVKGILHSEVAEQLHHSLNKSRHFLNQMKPGNHIFMLRSLIELHNDTVDLHIWKKMNSLTAATLALDEFGRGYLLGNKVERMVYENDLGFTEDSTGNHSDSDCSGSLFSDTSTNLAVTAPPPYELHCSSNCSPKKKRENAIVSKPSFDLKSETEKSRTWIEDADKNLIEYGCDLKQAREQYINGLQTVKEAGK